MLRVIVSPRPLARFLSLYTLSDVTLALSVGVLLALVGLWLTSPQPFIP